MQATWPRSGSMPKLSLYDVYGNWCNEDRRIAARTIDSTLPRRRLACNLINWEYDTPSIWKGWLADTIDLRICRWKAFNPQRPAFFVHFYICLYTFCLSLSLFTNKKNQKVHLLRVWLLFSLVIICFVILGGSLGLSRRSGISQEKRKQKHLSFACLCS